MELTGGFENPTIVELLSGAGRQQVRQGERLLGQWLLVIDSGLESGVGRIHETGLCRIRRYHQHAHAQVFEGAL